MSQKGSEFERTISKTLSLWWSHGKDDAIFWRTSQSGGRATERAKKGKNTKGQDGDYCATNPIGQPLMNVCTIESKTGYGHQSIMDLIDPTGLRKPMYDAFFEQCIRESESGGRPYWMLISRRFGREVMIYMPNLLYHQLVLNGARKLPNAKPYLYFECRLKSGRMIKVYGTTLKSFLKVKRVVRAFKRIARQLPNHD